MNSILPRLFKGTLLSLVGVFSVWSIVAAWNNLSTTGGTTTGGGGSGGSVGTLQEVLDEGNSATEDIILTGTLDAITVEVGAGTVSEAAINFGGAANDINTGLAQTDTTDSFDFIAGGNWRGRFNTASFQLNVDTVANADNTYDMGSLAGRFADGYFGGTVSSSALIASNASSTFFLSGASALVSTVAPIPTSTSFLAGTMPNQLYLFNATYTNCIYWTPGQLRGAWTGGNLTPVVSWLPAVTGTGDVVWRFGAQSLPDNTYVGTAFTGPFSYATSTVGNNLTRQIENMDSVAVQSAASNVPIRFEACRMGGQAGDTFGGDAYLELIKGEYSTPNVSD